MIHNKPSIEIFNLHNHRKIDFKDIPINTPIYAYLHIDKIWIHNDSIAMNIHILQVYTIDRDNSGNGDDDGDDDGWGGEDGEDGRGGKDGRGGGGSGDMNNDYSIFFKMLSLGIPKDAVKQKMILAGIDPHILDKPLPPPLPPPPPSKKGISTHQINSKKPSLSDLLAGKNNLKKLDTSKITKKIISSHNGPKPPCLDDILHGLKKLKSVGVAVAIK